MLLLMVLTSLSAWAADYLYLEIDPSDNTSATMKYGCDYDEKPYYDERADWWYNGPEWDGKGTIKTITVDGSCLNVNYSNLSALFYEFTGLETINNIGKLNTSNVQDMSRMFIGCTSLTTLDLNGWNTSHVTDMNDMFSGCSNLTTLYISGWDMSEVTNTGGMFEGCSSLASITIPASLTTIGNNAFKGCTSLTTVTLYASSCTLGDDAFEGCNNLANIYVFSDLVDTYKGADNWNANNIKSKIKAIPNQSGNCGTTDHESEVTWELALTSTSGVLTISGTGAMKNCVSGKPWNDYRSFITSVVIENGVTSIGDFAFQNYSNLTSVTFDGVSTLASIDSYAFSYTGLTSIEIPASVTSIGECAFIRCNNLASVSGCEGVTSIGEGAFHVTAWFTNQPDGVIYIGKVAYYGKNVSGVVSIDAGTVSISDGAFVDCTGLTSISIPASVTSIKWGAFTRCNSLTSISIPANVMTIDNSVFSYSGLMSINIPANVTSIGSNAFYSCGHLATVTFASGSQLTSIGDGAFQSSSLTSISIPASVTSIGMNAFWDCSDLTSVTISAGVTSIGSGAFRECTSLQSVTIPASVTSIGEMAFSGCTSLASVIIHATSLTTYGNDAFENNKDGRKIYVPNEAVTDYQNGWQYYASDIEAMAAYGTCGATGNEDKVIWSVTGTPSNYTLTISGAGAMADYTDANYQPWAANRLVIKTIVINEGVTSIGKYAFSNCEEATSVSIPASVTSIGYYSFNFCPNLSSLNIAANSSLKTIDNNAFYLCSGLESVSIPASVTSIGSSAFDCCSNLATVTLNSNPSIGEHAFDDIKAGATVTMNLTANGPVDGAYWATFYNKNYSFEADANTQVFKAELVGTKITLHEVANRVVDAGEGVVLKTTGGGNPEMTLTTDGSNDFTGNSLQGVDDPAGVTADGTTYVLNNGSNGVGFYKLKSGKTLGVGKAYLTYSGTTAPGFFGLDVDNENTTAINEHDCNATLSERELNESHELSGAWYDLQGRKIANGQKPTAKGLYIVNGKKVMIK